MADWLQSDFSPESVASIANTGGNMQDSPPMDMSTDFVGATDDVSFEQGLLPRSEIIDAMIGHTGCCHSPCLPNESETTSLLPSFCNIQQNTGPLPVCTICTEPAGVQGELYLPGCGCSTLFYHKSCMTQFARTTYASTGKSLKEIYAKCHVCKRKYSGITLRFMARHCEHVHKLQRLTTPEKRMAVMLKAGAMISLGEVEGGFQDLEKLVAYLAKTQNIGEEYERFRALRLLARAQCHCKAFAAAKKNLVIAEHILSSRKNLSETKKLAQIQALLGLLTNDERHKKQRKAYFDAAKRTLSKDEIEKIAKKFALEFEC